jgi:hypothetical protein
MLGEWVTVLNEPTDSPRGHTSDTAVVNAYTGHVLLFSVPLRSPTLHSPAQHCITPLHTLNIVVPAYHHLLHDSPDWPHAIGAASTTIA